MRVDPIAQLRRQVMQIRIFDSERRQERNRQKYTNTMWNARGLGRKNTGESGRGEEQARGPK